MFWRLSLFACFVTCLCVSLADCSLVVAEKPAKGAQPPRTVDSSGIEWKERKWEIYAKDRGGTQYYFERESLSYPAKNRIYVWKKRIFPGKSSSQKEIVSYDEIDCRDEKYRSLELQGVNWDDSTTIIYKRPTPWTPIFTDTADEYFLDTFCRGVQPPVGSKEK